MIPPTVISRSAHSYPEGWQYPRRAKRAHYFAGTVSLCGHWRWFNSFALAAAYSETHCCAECVTRLAQRREHERLQAEADGTDPNAH
jgi:hypothetical protein